MLKNMLLAVDGSAHANKAVDICAALAKKFGSRITVLHVLMRDAQFDVIYRAFKDQGLSTDVLDELTAAMPSIIGPYVVGPTSPVVPLLQLGTLGQRILDRAKARLEKEGIQNAKYLLEDGHTSKKILEVAESDKADAIIMGHRGLGALQEVVVGSVSTKVSHLAICTVITVK